MKRIIVNLCLLGCLTATPAIAQTAGGGASTGGGTGGTGGGATAGTSSGNTSAGATVGGAAGNAGAGANVAVPPTREPLPPGLPGQPARPSVPGVGAQGNASFNAGSNVLGADLNSSANGSLAGTNGSSGGTNQFGTNLTPVSRPDSGTNRIFWTNRFRTNMHGTNGISGTNGLGPQDVAMTEFDRTLIIRIRTTIIQRLGGTPAAWAPVSFNADNGVVTVAGAVASVVIKQRIVTTVQGFPGVVRVIDQLAVDPNLGFTSDVNAGGTTGAAVAFPPGRPLPPTSRELSVPRTFNRSTTVSNAVPATTP